MIESEEKIKYETVFIHENKRKTLCISSQAGCSLSCKFCSTGKQKFQKNLTSDEILGQVMNYYQKHQSLPTNIVFMGQGEPVK